MPPIRIRPATSSDEPCIYATWINSYKRAPVAARIPSEVYRVGQRRIVDRLLARSDTLIACPDGEDDVIVGWACIEPNQLHYVYVKPPFRRMGVASELLKNQEIQRFSHLTVEMLKFYKAKLGDPLFDPYLCEP